MRKRNDQGILHVVTNGQWKQCILCMRHAARPRLAFSVAAETLAVPDRRSWPFIGSLNVCLSYRIPPPTAVQAAWPQGSAACMWDVMRCYCWWWRLCCWCCWIVFRDVDFVLSRHRRRLCEFRPSVTKSFSASRSLYACLYLSHSDADWQRDRQAGDVRCDLSSDSFASHFTL